MKLIGYEFWKLKKNKKAIQWWVDTVMIVLKRKLH